jgi:amino acid adenylation domain-containing protein
MRVEVIRIAQDIHVIALVKHHIISDGWSMEVLARDLVSLYNQGVRSEKMSLTDLPFQYKDFTKWQNGRIDSAQYRANADYWLDRFKDIPEPLELPYDKARFKVKTSNGALFTHTISQESYLKIRAFADSHEVSVFMMTMAAFKLLFYRYTGKTDITIGTPSAGRYQPGLEDQIGFFVNTLALRTRFDEEETFSSLLDKVKATVIAALEHEDYPFDELISKLDPEKRMDHSPLFDVVVQFMNTGSKSDGKAGFEGLETRAFKTEWKTSQYDQTFSFTETSHGIHVAVEYNTDLFHESTIRREIEHIENILLACIEQPQVGIHKVQFLTREELKAHSRLISIDARYPEKSIPVLFREAAAKDPGKTAIYTSIKRTTFGELNDRVKQLSSFLYQITGGQKTRVGLLMNEGGDAIGSMLSCLTAGQCYVPISPSLPYNRQKYIVEDAQIEVLIFSKDFLREAGQLYWECSKLQYVICLDSDNITAEIEKPRDIMSEELWDFVGTSSNDEITAGAWFSSYNGLPISREEMDEYAGNAFKKLEPILNPAARVLEIGCASGLTMAMIAPKVHSYVGTDLSAEILEVAAKHVKQKNISNVKLVHAAAHDVIKHLEGEYDIVIFNSVVQCFSGYNYFRKVVTDLIPFLSEKATILFGDLQDLEMKEDLINDLKHHARLNPQDKVKLDWSQELFLTRSFFEDLRCHLPFKTSSEPSRKTGTIENELTKYRFDVVFTIDKAVTQVPSVSNWHDLSSISRTPGTSVPDGHVVLDEPAYIIYTSGSTGQPKGCIVSQRNLVRLFFNENHSFPFHAREVWMQSHGYHFDFSVLEIYGALLYGSTLVVPSASEVRDVSAFYALIKEQRITVLGQTPQVFYQFSSFVLRQNDVLNLSEHLRYIIFGGEKIIPGKLKEWAMVFPEVKLINMYGPTETTVHVTYHQLKQDEILNEPSVSNLGHPLPDICIILEDKYGNLVPYNVPAEIKIGGCGVGLGYYNREALTSERFIPMDGNETGRVYLSGDYGKVSPKGDLIFLARKDNQLKIRGYRIETAEIEAAMLQYPTIKEAVVVDMKDAAGDEYLAMYYTGGAEQPETLAKFLKANLPTYMVPARFIHLDKIPLTSNGKLDSGKLTAVVSLESEVHSIDEEGWSPAEKAVAQAFREILDLDRVSLEQNFFESGGHSLKAMSLMSLLHSRQRVGVPLVYLYKHPTVRKIADYIDLARFMNIQYKEHPYLKLGDPAGNTNIILFPPVLGSALAYGHLADLLPGITVYSFNYVDNNDTMQNYVRMIQEIQPDGKIHIAGHSAGGFMAFHVAKAMEKAGREVGSVIIIDAFRGGKEGKKHSLEFIAKEMDIYVEAKFEEYKSHFIDMEFFKEVCSKQVKQYYDFLYHMEQEGDLLIKAPIYLMKAENNYERKENWSEWTETGVTEILSAGIHRKMMDEAHVKDNAVIIHQILEMAENKK